MDSNVFIVSLLDTDKLNPQERLQRPLALSYIHRLEEGTLLIHLPRIAVIEIVGVVRIKVGISVALAVRNRLEQWISQGIIRLHDLEERRMRSAVDLVIRHNVSRRRSISAPDAEFLSLAEELNVNLASFDTYLAALSVETHTPS